MTNGRVVVLYGSQTGSAQDVAERIWREGKRYKLSGPVLAMDDFDIRHLIHEKLVIFVCSTTGQGEEPDNMKGFWKFLLRRNLPSDSLIGLKFAVLGLGDSSYAKFNFSAKKLYRRVLALGGTSLVPIGLADDQHDLGADAVVDPWISQLWNSLVIELSLSADDYVFGDNEKVIPRWNVAIVEHYEGPQQPQVSDKVNAFPVNVKSNVRTTHKDHFQDVRLISFSNTSTNFRYQPGDVLMVQPQNLSASVDTFIELVSGMKVDGSISEDTVFLITEADADMAVPDALQEPLTLRNLATYYWDLNAVPRRYMLELLSQVTPNELEKDKLKELASPSGQEEMFNYLNRPKRTVLELLGDFPHALNNFPYTLLFELLPAIRPRAFSIASSPQMHPGELQVLVAIVNYKTKLLKPRFGLCSNWLASLRPCETISVWLRRGSLRFPVQKNVPVIMVGPGTGVAPFRSYINDRAAEGTAQSDLLYLFFGCRNKEKDFHCCEEWSSLVKADKLSLFCAFSRDQEDKVYVQHVIAQHAHLLGSLICAGAYVFVAGNSNSMPMSVREAIMKCVLLVSNKTEDFAENFLSQMEKDGKYQTETWA